jgi:hypothetical protein
MTVHTIPATDAVVGAQVAYGHRTLTVTNVWDDAVPGDGLAPLAVLSGGTSASPLTVVAYVVGTPAQVACDALGHVAEMTRRGLWLCQCGRTYGATSEQMEAAR